MLRTGLSVCLATLLLAGTLTVTAGAAAYTDAKDIKNTPAVSVLTELQVLTGDEAGAFLPSALVTRGEMVKIMTLLLNGGRDPNFTTTPTSYSYSDTEGHWAATYIEYGTALGLVSGKGDGTFDPDGQVTTTQAAKMLLTALGYIPEIEKMSGSRDWAMYTDVRANYIGLYQGYEGILSAAPLTRDNAAQLVFNALSAEEVSYEYLHNSLNKEAPLVAKSIGRGRTLLNSKFNQELIDGVLTPIVKSEK